MADARSRLDAVRAEAYSAHLAALDEERAKLDSETREEADRVRDVAAARLANLVAQVLDGVWATAGLPPGGTPFTGARELARWAQGGWPGASAGAC